MCCFTFSHELTLFQIDEQLNLATEAYLESDEALMVTPPSDPLMPNPVSSSATATASTSSAPRTPSSTVPSSPSKDGAATNTTEDGNNTNPTAVSSEADAIEEVPESAASESQPTSPSKEKKGEDESASAAKASPGVVHLSMLFKWYHNDFGKDQEEVLKWIYERVPDQVTK